MKTFAILVLAATAIAAPAAVFNESKPCPTQNRLLMVTQPK